MLEMIKKFLCILLLNLFGLNLGYSATTPPALRAKMFLYSSKLPSTLKKQERNLRKHVIDVLLSTQKYNVVFSKIPKIISKGDVSQQILKYKLRTSVISDSLFDVEYFLIDADNIRIIKKIKYIDIPKSKLLYSFRLHLYEFILGRKLSNSEELSFNKKTKNKINKFNKEDNNADNSKIANSKIIQNIGSIKRNKTSKLTINKKNTSISLNTIPPSATTETKSNKFKNKKKNLWDLLRDNDSDSSWRKKNKVARKNKITNKNNDKTNDNKKDPSSKVVGPENPFLKTKVNLLENKEEEEDIRLDMFHFAWRIVDRTQDVQDLVGLTNSFFSILGATFEWVIHNPLNIKNLYVRTGFEVDTSLKTEPIKLSDHSLFRVGFGYKLPFSILTSLYMETNSLVFANLNTAGKGFEDNIVSLFWATTELALLMDQFYLSAQYSKSIGSTTVLEGLEFGEMVGNRLGLNVRYYFKASFLGMKPWTDFEYRMENFKSNTRSSQRELQITKNELALRFGIYF